MDLEPIIKAAPAIAKGAAVVGAAIPFTAIVKRMLGPAADEVAEMWRDKVRLYRHERQIKCVEKAENMAKNAGFTPKVVPPKILFPLLEGASLEDNEGLHTMWAALLANAASPDTSENVRPGFIAVLRQMAPDEAGLLNWISTRITRTAHVCLPLHDLYSDLGFKSGEDDAHLLRVCLGGLEAVGIFTSMTIVDFEQYSFTFETGGPNFSSGQPWQLTRRGVEFVRACRPPEPKS
jgi:hypothetical protein